MSNLATTLFDWKQNTTFELQNILLTFLLSFIVGTPYINRPPHLSFLSYTVTQWPAYSTERKHRIITLSDYKKTATNYSSLN